MYAQGAIHKDCDSHSAKTRRPGADALPHRFRLPVLLATALASIGSALAEAPSFRGLGQLPWGDFSVRPTGISADGSIIVGNGHTNGQNLAVQWTAASGYRFLLAPDGTSHWLTTVAGISGDGFVTAGHENEWQWGAPFVLTQPDGYLPLGELPDGATGSIVADLSTDGTSVAGFGYGANGPELFRWRASDGMVGLGVANEAFGNVLIGAVASTSADGAVIASNWYNEQTLAYEAFRWTATSGAEGLGGAPGGILLSFAGAISDDGNVIVGWFFGFGSARAARWETSTGWVELGDPPNQIVNSRAHGVSADGAVIVGDTRSETDGVRGFLWTARDGMLDVQELLTDGYGLDLSGWSRLVPMIVSADGRFVSGNGNQQPDHMSEGWLARIADVSCIGDFDQDRSRGLSDLALLLAHFATPQGATHADGDIDDDGDVDLQDLTFLLSNFGRRCPGT